MPPTVVLGIGNLLRCDDGAGIHALNRVRHRLHAVSPEAATLDAGSPGLHLLPDLEDYPHWIALDAARLGAPPGTVRLFEGAAVEEFLGLPQRTSHEVGLADLLCAARLRGRFPSRLALIGVQPGSLDWADQPTPAVAAALDGIAGMVLAIARRWSAADCLA